MIKLNMRAIQFIPESRNFSTFAEHVPSEHSDDKPLEYEATDEGEQINKSLSNLQGDELLLNLLLSLDTRDKVVLLYQVLREAGYNLQYGDCARTLSLSRGRYMILLKDVKRKCIKILRNQKLSYN
jgi:DNA-directed RNA polymerase specialized sigma24 family protein